MISNLFDLSTVSFLLTGLLIVVALSTSMMRPSPGRMMIVRPCARRSLLLRLSDLLSFLLLLVGALIVLPIFTALIFLLLSL